MGIGGITTSGSGNTVTIDGSGLIQNITLNTDVGGPLVGDTFTLTGTNIYTSGSGSTVSYNLQGTNHSLFVGRGNLTPSVSLGVAANGQIPIGSSVSDPVLATITAGTGITVTNGPGSITLAVNGSVVGETITGNTGGALSPTAGNWNILTANTTVKFAGAVSTLTQDFSMTNLLMGSSGSLISGGVNNVGIGQSTLSLLTSGSTNTAIGNVAMGALQNGSDNVAVGYAAMNTANGAGCTNNVAVGSSAMSSSLTSASNTAVGYQALALLTSGASNTAVGRGSFVSILTGTQNVGLGYFAGHAYTGAESNNICIGYNVTGTLGESNICRLGNTSITDSYLQGNVHCLTGNLDVTRASSGGIVSSTISNTSNTASSNALELITVSGASAGDAYTNYNVSGTTDWSIGLDNSDSDAFVLSPSSSLGTNNIFRTTIDGSNIRFRGQVSGGTTTDFAVVNQATAAGSDVRLAASISSGSAGDPYLQVSNPASMNYCWGIDTSDSNTLKICADANSNTATPSGSTVLYKLTSSGAASYVNGNFDVTRSAGGSTVSTTVSNTSNTANSNALQQVTVAGTSAGDPFTTYTVSGTTNWSIGADNSVTGDPFVISASTALGTSNVLSLDTAGNSTFSNTGTSASLTIRNFNSDTNAASDSLIWSSVNTGSSADPYFRCGIGATRSYAFGLDNSDSSKFKLTTAANGAATLADTSLLEITTAGTIKFPFGQIVAVTAPGAYPYTTLATDYVIIVDTSAARTINLLASPETGRTYRIKDNVGSAAANNITITPAAGNIDGAASYAINTNYGSVDVCYSGSQWIIL